MKKIKKILNYIFSQRTLITVILLLVIVLLVVLINFLSSWSLGKIEIRHSGYLDVGSNFDLDVEHSGYIDN